MENKDIESVAYSRLRDSYYGPNAAIGDGSIIAFLMEILKQFLGSCIPGLAIEVAKNRPHIAQRRAERLIRIEARQTGEEVDVSRGAKAIVATAAASTVEEAQAFRAL